jgi:chromosomal replication initiation ATPase DnaA
VTERIAKSEFEVQLTLPLGRDPTFSRDLFVVSDGNREAVEAIDAWPDWPGRALALVGPEGSGKTHLAMAWAARADAAVANGSLDPTRLPTGPVLVEDADRAPIDEALFHLLSRPEPDAGLLLTARLPPRLWPTTLPDLRSRLNALRSVELGGPDDTILRGVMTVFFRDRNIRPDDDVIDYLVRRIERSAPAAREVVARLDAVAGASRREVTKVLAREVLEGGDKTLDRLG